MINSKLESINDFIENLYMLCDEGVISEFEYGRLIGAICVTRGVAYENVIVKSYEECNND